MVGLAFMKCGFGDRDEVCIVAVEAGSVEGDRDGPPDDDVGFRR